jgi:adenylate cyclase
MPLEVERKFLIRDSSWRREVRNSLRLRQGYLPCERTAAVRVRIEGERAFLNIKSATLDITRREYEYEIPAAEAQELLDHLCQRPLIEKTRHLVEHAGQVWEIDEFEGDNAGLVVAELELDGVDAAFERPAWLGPEVSDDPRYYNASLVRHPYKEWAPVTGS